MIIKGLVKKCVVKGKAFSTGVSNSRMAEILNCKVWKARQTMQEITNAGIFYQKGAIQTIYSKRTFHNGSLETLCK